MSSDGAHLIRVEVDWTSARGGRIMRQAEPDECRQDEVEKRVRGELSVVLNAASFRKREAMATYGSCISREDGREVRG